MTRNQHELSLSPHRGIDRGVREHYVYVVMYALCIAYHNRTSLEESLLQSLFVWKLLAAKL